MPAKLGWRSGKPSREPPVAGFAQTGNRCFSASATAASQPPDASISGPVDERRLRRRGEAARQLGERVRVRSAAAGDGAGARVVGAVGVGLLRPVVHRDRDEHRPARGQRRVVDRARERAGDVLCARRLVAPLDVRLRADRRVAVGQIGLDRDLGADLLAGGYHQRRLVRLRVEDPADGVADARSGVKIDVGRAPGRLRETVGHPDDRLLLEPEHVPEVVREVGQHRQLRRAGVAEDRRHPVGAEQLERRFADCGHRAWASLVGSPRP